MGTDTDDPHMTALVGELSVKSDRFRWLWARQDVVRRAGDPARIHHPEVGDLELHRERLVVAGTEGQVLAIYHRPRHRIRPGASPARNDRGQLRSVPASGTPGHRTTEREPVSRPSPQPPAHPPWLRRENVPRPARRAGPAFIPDAAGIARQLTATNLGADFRRVVGNRSGSDYILGP